MKSYNLNEIPSNIKECKSIAQLFLLSLNKYSKRNALWVNNVYYTYNELFMHSFHFYNLINKFDEEQVAIFSCRNIIAYTSILGTLFSEKAYVPLNPKVPFLRNKISFDAAKTNLIVIDNENKEEALKFLSEYTSPLNIILSSCEDLIFWKEKLPQHNYFSIDFKTNLEIEKIPLSKVNLNDNACLLFTSGSTDTPKGVMLSHLNIISYIDHTIERYSLNCDDRVSQVTELTFDFSIQDMFMSWAVGACVYAFPEDYFLGFPQFIQNNKITFMTTVPSTPRILSELNKLKPNMFPSLRRNIFGGEPFSDAVAEIWQQAAPNSIIDNVCGPTEATIAFTAYTWSREKALQKPNRTCIPIGKPFPGQNIFVIDDNLNPVKNGETGELLLSGSQVAKNYWQNKKLSDLKFISIVDSNGVKLDLYRTGDLVAWDDDDGLIFKGRVDDQIKIRGYRIGKLEIEKVLRDEAQTESAAIVPWPVTDEGIVQGLVGFISHSKYSEETILKSCRNKLPNYMIPSELIFIDELPLNVNGKTDYIKLKEKLKARI